MAIYNSPYTEQDLNLCIYVKYRPYISLMIMLNLSIFSQEATYACIYMYHIYAHIAKYLHTVEWESFKRLNFQKRLLNKGLEKYFQNWNIISKIEYKYLKLTINIKKSINVSDLRKATFHTNDIKTHFSPLNDSCTRWLTIQAGIDAESYLGYFYCGLFLRPVRRPRVLGSPSNGYISPWQADSQL